MRSEECLKSECADITTTGAAVVGPQGVELGLDWPHGWRHYFQGGFKGNILQMHTMTLLLPFCSCLMAVGWLSGSCLYQVVRS